MISTVKSSDYIEKCEQECGNIMESQEFAFYLDKIDPLKELRSEFNLPQKEGKELVYLLGNSLGAQPKTVPELIKEEVSIWGERGVDGHFDHPKGRQWVILGDEVAAMLTDILGAREDEIAIMGSLTSNIHLLLCAFYHPTAERYKIVIDGHAFPSDHYALQSQLRMHGVDPVKGLVILPNDGGQEEIEKILKEHGGSIAVVMMAGVQYYTGRVFDMQAITRTAQSLGAYVGFDLAHAVGNIPLSLHDWGVDFAAWCSYKYLNGGPGAVAGLFVHERHDDNGELTVLHGWWSHKEETRFNMTNELDPIRGAKRFQLSNTPAFLAICLWASLQVFAKTDMVTLRSKSIIMVEYFRRLVKPLLEDKLMEIMTPENPVESGSQISMLIHHDNVRQLQKDLQSEGIVTDYRHPDVIRLSFAPLYNTFSEVHKTVFVLSKLLKK